MALVHDTLNNYQSHAPDCITIMDPSSTARPQSALARGVKITEFKDTKANPEPILVEESQLLLDDYISPRKLRDLTGLEDLEDVHYLEMKVDTTDTSLGNFGNHVPNLTQLKLSNSIIPNIRDLGFYCRDTGSALGNVRVLWMARCCLEDIDGICSFESIKELYLAYNEIVDISPLSMIDNLTIVDLEGNNVDDIAQVEFLAMCSKLTHVTLEGNPMCVMPSPDSQQSNYDYRYEVHTRLPHLKYLDDEPLAPQKGPTRSGSVFEDDWKLLDELLQEVSIPDSEEISQTSGRPTTALRPTTGYRPGSALKPYSRRPGSAKRPTTGFRPDSGGRPTSGRLGSGGRPTTASYRPGTTASIDLADETADDSSDLTQGGVVCGNPSQALKARSRKINKVSNRPTHPAFEQFRHKPEHTYDSLEEDENLHELVAELKEWRMGHQKKKAEIEASKAPQVLTIDHDDALSLSDDDDSVCSELEDDDLATSLTFQPHPHRSTCDSGISADVHDTSALEPAFSPEMVKPRPPPDPAGARPKLRNSSNRYIESQPNRRRLTHDESFDATEERSPSHRTYKSQSVESMGSPGPLLPSPDECRPYSGPEGFGSPTKFRLEAVDKSEPKVIDNKRPVIRSSVQSPEQRVPNGPRAVTSRAVLGQPQRIRRQLPKTPILPSKVNVPK